MNGVSVRDGRFDLAIVAGQNLPLWPSVGVRAISTLAAEMGLRVGVYGGDSLTVRGVLPLPGTGGIAVVEDAQHRVHRIQARAVVRMSASRPMPDPFPGWNGPGMIPLDTARRLVAQGAPGVQGAPGTQGKISWAPATVILGTGNPALRFGSQLLDSGTEEVYCVEALAEWGAKRYAGWEVERRRFEALGGKILEAAPISLQPKAALLWELRLRDPHGVRVLDVARVVSAGPYRDLPAVREYPAGSFLFELDQTSALTPEEDIQGWVLEEERGRWLAGRIVRSLVADLGSRREELDRVLKRAKGRLKRYQRHFEAPFTPAYSGKWIAASEARQMRAFSGVPRAAHKLRPVASIECFEEIPCDLCARACPEEAIEIGKVPRPEQPVLDESRCVSCGLCLEACPSGAALLMHEGEDRPTAELTLPWSGASLWKPGEFATLVNRRGESLGSGRVKAVRSASPDGLKEWEPGLRQQLVQVEVPAHLVWDARGLRKAKASNAEDGSFLAAISMAEASAGKVEILFNGEKRLVREGIPISLALFETGRSRPGDNLLCQDGSCGLCQVKADGVKKLACRTLTHRGMTILSAVDDSAAPDASRPAGRYPARHATPAEAEAALHGEILCPCLNIRLSDVLERLHHGALRSPEAVISALHVGEGKCHGQLCTETFRRLLMAQGLDASQWIDWRFPSSDWVLTHNRSPSGTSQS